jgi:hypothetical protein
MKKLMTILSVAMITAAAWIKYTDSANLVWSIGDKDLSGSEFALAPDGFEKFIENDFGFEDDYFIIGHNEIQNDFPFSGTGACAIGASACCGSTDPQHRIQPKCRLPIYTDRPSFFCRGPELLL